MFCQKCGGEQEKGAKFCQGCGKPTVGADSNSPVQVGEPLQEKVFLSNGGILVSDVVFKTNSGASYPIRNISSVSVAVKPNNVFVVLIAIVLTLLGLFFGFVNVVIGFILVLLSGPFWYVASDRPYQLKIGAGGVLQTAIESTNENQLDDVARAINDSILYIQRGV